MSGFCIHCGNHLSLNSAFCDACGHAVLPPEQAGKTASPHAKEHTQSQEKITKRNPLLAAAAVAAVLITLALGGLLWPMGIDSGNAAAGRSEERDALTMLMGRWASTQASSVAQFEFTPETITTLGHTFAASYAPASDGISVSVGNPPHELAKLIVVTPNEIQLKGAATVTLYRIH
jgi:hypothetical protein